MVGLGPRLVVLAPSGGDLCISDFDNNCVLSEPVGDAAPLLAGPLIGAAAGKSGTGSSKIGTGPKTGNSSDIGGLDPAGPGGSGRSFRRGGDMDRAGDESLLMRCIL